MIFLIATESWTDPFAWFDRLGLLGIFAFGMFLAARFFTPRITRWLDAQIDLTYHLKDQSGRVGDCLDSLDKKTDAIQSQNSEILGHLKTNWKGI